MSSLTLWLPLAVTPIPWPRFATVLALRRRSCESDRPTSSNSLKNVPRLLRRT
jgi:hypothetical protein